MLALVSVDAEKGPSLVALYETAPGSINMPAAKIAVDAPEAGWKSEDGAHSLVEVTPFVAPEGMVAVGSPGYELAPDGSAVTEIYATKLAIDPPPPPEPFTPQNVFAALKAWDTAKAVFEGTSQLDQIDFSIAVTIARDNPWLLSALATSGKTVDDLDAAIAGA